MSIPVFFASLARSAFFVYTLRALMEIPKNKWSLVSLAMELGFIIALPLLVFALTGKWLDTKVGNDIPWFTLLGVVLAITSTTVWLTRKLKTFIK